MGFSGIKLVRMRPRVAQPQPILAGRNQGTERLSRKLMPTLCLPAQYGMSICISASPSALTAIESGVCDLLILFNMLWL